MNINSIKIKLLLLIICISLLSSCDILRCESFEVASWLPGDGFHVDPENITVSLKFTLTPDRGSVERNFSFTGNGIPVKGTFLWDDKEVSFKPLMPLEVNTDYSINLTSDAFDTKGLSMDVPFSVDFTTRPDNERPVLLSCYPQMYEVIDDLRAEVQLSFSTPIQLNSLYSSVSFSPSMTGSWRLEENDDESTRDTPKTKTPNTKSTLNTNGILAIFSPAEPWNQQTKYEIKCSTSLTGINGMNASDDFLSVFTVGTDNEEPYMVSAKRKTKNNEYINLSCSSLDVNIINENWEKEDKLSLVFSEPVDWVTVKNNLSVVGETVQTVPSLVLESYSEKEFIFKFDTAPDFETKFAFFLKPGIKDYAGNLSKDEYIFRVYANGRLSKPPELVGIRMPMAPSKANLQLFSAVTESNFTLIPITNEHYPPNVNVSTWIELYFDAAANIDTFSVMELFRVDTSNLVLSFSPRSIKTTNFSVSRSQTGLEKYQRIEITGILTNSANFGIINFQIGPGLRDNLGNKNESTQRISLIK